MFEFAYPDIALKSFYKGKLVVENKGGLPMPFEIKVINTDGTEDIITKTAEVWKNENKTVTPKIKSVKVPPISMLNWTISKPPNLT